MKILIIGASGLVGWNLQRIAATAGHQIVGTCKSFLLPGLVCLDMEDIDAVRRLFQKNHPDAVVCCASWSWVDGCEQDPVRAYHQNRDLPVLAARLAMEARARFVHFSSSYIFDGKCGPYSEIDTPNPLSIYGKSKLAGEQAVMEATEGNAIIARTMGVYGEEPQQKNFVYQVRKTLSAGHHMKIPTDQLGNATHAPNIADMILKLLDNEKTGIWNVAGPNPNLSRKDFALEIAAAYGLDDSLFDFLTTQELQQPAPRPAHGGLRLDKAMQLGWIPTPFVRSP